MEMKTLQKTKDGYLEFTREQPMRPRFEELLQTKLRRKNGPAIYSELNYYTWRIEIIKSRMAHGYREHWVNQAELDYYLEILPALYKKQNKAFAIGHPVKRAREIAGTVSLFFFSVTLPISFIAAITGGILDGKNELYMALALYTWFDFLGLIARAHDDAIFGPSRERYGRYK